MKTRTFLVVILFTAAFIWSSQALAESNKGGNDSIRVLVERIDQLSAEIKQKALDIEKQASDIDQKVMAVDQKVVAVDQKVMAVDQKVLNVGQLVAGLTSQFTDFEDAFNTPEIGTMDWQICFDLNGSLEGGVGLGLEGQIGGQGKIGIDVFGNGVKLDGAVNGKLGWDILSFKGGAGLGGNLCFGGPLLTVDVEGGTSGLLVYLLDAIDFGRSLEQTQLSSAEIAQVQSVIEELGNGMKDQAGPFAALLPGLLANAQLGPENFVIGVETIENSLNHNMFPEDVFSNPDLMTASLNGLPFRSTILNNETSPFTALNMDLCAFNIFAGTPGEQIYYDACSDTFQVVCDAFFLLLGGCPL